MTIALIVAGVVMGGVGTLAAMLVGYRVRGLQYDNTSIYVLAWFAITVSAFVCFYIAGTMAGAQ